VVHWPDAASSFTGQRVEHSVNDDPALYLFLAMAAGAVILIVAFGITSSRRRTRAASPGWQVTQGAVLGQPVLESSGVDVSDTRQWQLFQDQFAAGSLHPVARLEDGVESSEELRVSRVSRSLREGWPRPKLGFSAYFQDFEGTEFPATIALPGNRALASVTADAGGLRVSGPDGQLRWAATWTTLRFSNGDDLVLHNGSEPLRVNLSRDDGRNDLEELVIKYGAFSQMHY
jgi:hypothetical protein